MDRATGAYGDTGVAEMDQLTGSIYSGDPRVDNLHRILYIVSYHLISSYHRTNYTLHHSHLLIPLALSDSSWIHATASILTAG